MSWLKHEIPKQVRDDGFALYIVEVPKQLWDVGCVIIGAV